jgi:hypothetical protein
MNTTKPVHQALILAIALAASACTVSVPRVALAPPGVHVRPQVAAGYATYEAQLSPWGTWSPDRAYGVRWCPSQEATGGSDVHFQPYLSRGHWDVGDGAEGGRPVWRSEDSDTWGEITTHHGWWVRPDGHPDTWCWIPGAEETSGHVAWREGDGFVGWAPEPPDAEEAVDDADYDDMYDWVYSLLGTLTSGHTDQNTLTGAARDRAQAATAPARKANGSVQRQGLGPSGNSIAAARQALGQYAAQHPDALAASAALHPSLAAGAIRGSGGSKSSKSSSKAKESSEKESVTVTAGVAAPAMPSPNAMTYYDALMMQPPVGVAGPVPQVHGATATAGGIGSTAASGAGAGATGSAASGITSEARAHGATVRSASSTGKSSGHGSSSHASGKSSHSSKSSKSSHSSRSSRSSRSHR